MLFSENLQTKIILWILLQKRRRSPWDTRRKHRRDQGCVPEFLCSAREGGSSHEIWLIHGQRTAEPQESVLCQVESNESSVRTCRLTTKATSGCMIVKLRAWMGAFLEKICRDPTPKKLFWWPLFLVPFNMFKGRFVSQLQEVVEIWRDEVRAGFPGNLTGNLFKEGKVTNFSSHSMLKPKYINPQTPTTATMDYATLRKALRKDWKLSVRHGWCFAITPWRKNQFDAVKASGHMVMLPNRKVQLLLLLLLLPQMERRRRRRRRDLNSMTLWCWSGSIC